MNTQDIIAYQNLAQKRHERMEQMREYYESEKGARESWGKVEHAKRCLIDAQEHAALSYSMSRSLMLQRLSEQEYWTDLAKAFFA
jgi:hypothetical protein